MSERPTEHEIDVAFKAAQTLLKVRVVNEPTIAALKRAHVHWNDDSSTDDSVIQDGVVAALHALKLIGELRYAHNEEVIMAIAAAVVYLDGSAPPKTKVTISK